MEPVPSGEIEVDIRAVQFEFIPNTITVAKGTRVIIYITESSSDEEHDYPSHTFTLSSYGINEVLPLGTGTREDPLARIEFVADIAGEFHFECAVFCGTGHADMKGTLIVTETEGVVEERRSLLELSEINATLEILKMEDTLPSSPQHFTEDDLEYLMLVIQREAESVYVVNGRTLEGIKNITDLGVMPHVVVYNPVERRWAYVIARDGWLSLIDLWSLDISRRIQVGFDSRGIAVSDDGKYVITGNYDPNSAVVLDALTLEPLKVIQTFGVNPDGEAVKSRVAAVLESGTYGYFTIALKEAGQVWVIDYKSPDFPVVGTLEDVGRILHDGWFTEDARFFLIASQKDDYIAVIDLETLSVAKRVPTTPTPHPGSGAIYGDYAFTSSVGEADITVFDTRNWEMVEYLWPYGIDIKSGGGLFVSQIPPGVEEKVPYLWSEVFIGPYNGTLYIIDASTLEVVEVIRDASAGYGKRALHAEYNMDGSYVFVSVWDANKLLIYDTMTFALVGSIENVTTPTGIFGAWRVHVPGL